MVQKVFGICEAKNATETFELLQTETNGYHRIWQNDEKSKLWKTVESQPGMQKRIEGKRKESRERSIRGW